jgi:tetratricopeptide (TPR) repeat protein
MKATNYLPFLMVLVLLITQACGGSETDTPTDEPRVVSTNPTISVISEKIRENPEDASLYASRAGVYYENGGYDEAIVDLERALILDSTNLEYLTVLADIYLDYYRSRKALETMEKAAELYPLDIPTLLKLASFQVILKQHNDGLKTLERVRELQPLNADMFYLAGLALEDMGRKDQAINSYQSAVENDPDMVEAWLALAKLWSEEDPEVAIHFYDNALRVAPSDTTALHEKALFLANKKDDLQGALELYRKIITLNQQYEDAYLNSGLLYLDLDSIEAAKQQFDLAIQIEPTLVNAYYYRGIANELLNQPQLAISDYEQAIRLNDQYKEAEEALNRLRSEITPQ